MQPTHIGDIKGWINELAIFEQHRRCTAPIFLRPYHFVTLGLHIWRLGTGVTLPESLAAYASRMRLWHSIGLPPPVYVNEASTQGRFMPLQRLDDRDQVMDNAINLAKLATTYGADPETEDSLGISLSEIMENCFAHGEVEDGLVGLACAQSWPRGKKAQIAICDLGVGIRDSLSANPDLQEQLNSQNSCALASQFGITSKPGRGHAGYGLALTRQLMERNGGTLLIVSQGEWFCTYGNHASGGLMTTPWSGTLVVIEWNTDRPLKVKDVYSSWPLPEGFTDDDFDF